MKKNKTIEVRIEEVPLKGAEQQTKHQLYAGKKLMGEVLPLENGKFQVLFNDQQIAITKHFEAGYEEIIRLWNLEQ